MVIGNKGQAQQIFFLLLMGGLLASIVVFFYLYTLIVPVITKTTNDINDLTGTIAGTDTPDANNITESLSIATNSISGINSVLSWLGYFLLFGLLIGFLIIAFNVRSHPYLGIFWVFLIIVLGMLTMWLSNSYEEIKVGDEYMRSAYESNVINDFLMTHLPHVIVSFGLIGGLLLFVLISKDPEMEVYQ